MHTEFLRIRFTDIKLLWQIARDEYEEVALNFFTYHFIDQKQTVC